MSLSSQLVRCMAQAAAPTFGSCGLREFLTALGKSPQVRLVSNRAYRLNNSCLQVAERFTACLNEAVSVAHLLSVLELHSEVTISSVAEVVEDREAVETRRTTTPTALYDAWLVLQFFANTPWFPLLVLSTSVLQLIGDEVWPAPPPAPPWTETRPVSRWHCACWGCRVSRARCAPGDQRNFRRRRKLSRLCRGCSLAIRECRLLFSNSCDSLSKTTHLVLVSSKHEVLPFQVGSPIAPRDKCCSASGRGCCGCAATR
jgi:hypothetical protein